MKAKNLMRIAAIMAGISLLGSCTMDPYVITAKEEYTRNFIKSFGLIDPAQDWNMAQASSLTVNTGDTPADVKLYALVSGKYYLVADLKQISGSVDIPVDIPKGVTDMLVKANGKTFKAAPGGNVDINGAGSRSIASGAPGGNFENGDFKLNVAQNGYAMYNTQQLAPINYTSGPWADYYSLSTTKGGSGWMQNEKNVSGFMPEIDMDKTAEKYEPDTGNLFAKDDYNGREINRDFYIKPGDDGSFTIQPVFWNTNGHHTLCVYPLDDEGNPISKTTGKPLRLKDFDQVVDASLLKDNVLDWEYLKDHTLEEVKSHIVSGQENEVMNKVHEAVKAFTDDILIMPFFDDKTADDIQLASVIVPSGTLSSLQLNYNSNLSLFTGDSQTCPIVYSPSDYVGVYSVTSSDKNVVEAWITYNGNYPVLNVKGLAAGTAVVTVTSQGISAQVTVTVGKGDVALSAYPTELFVGESLEIGVDKTGLYKDKPIVFSSSDTNVVTVDGNKVTAVGVGQATITGKCDDLTREVVITVCKESDHYYINVSAQNIDYNTEIGKRYRSNEWGGWKFSEDVTVEEFVSDMASYFSEPGRLNAISGNNNKAPTGTKAGDIANYTFAGIYDWDNTTGDSESELTAFPGEWGSIAVKVSRSSDSFSAPRHYPAPAPRHIQSPLSASRAEDTDDDSMPECLKEENVTGWTNVGSNMVTFTQDQLNTPNLARSMTYKVDITIDGAPYTGNLGMCIIYGSQTFFSQTLLNYAIGTYPCPDKVSPCYAASFLHPMSGRVFFSFEDWALNGDTDLQDLIFILTDAEKIEGTNTIDPDPEPEPEVTEETISWLVAAEDLGVVDDFDFNDVIFTVTSVTTNKGDQVDAYGSTVISKKVTVQALAAGGTLETYLHFHNGATDYVLGPDGYAQSGSKDMEWHQWFDRSAASEMINTGRKSVAKPASIDISAIVPDDFSMAEYCKVDANGRMYGFYITVNGWDGTMADVGVTSVSDEGEVKVITSAEPGAAPQMFVIPDIGHKEGEGWYWPTERTHIMNAYTGFSTWVNDADAGAGWYKNTPSGRTMRINP